MDGSGGQAEAHKAGFPRQGLEPLGDELVIAGKLQVEPLKGRLDFCPRHNQLGMFGLRSAWAVSPLSQTPFLSRILRDRSAFGCLG